MGLRMALKQDLHTTSAELVYGSPISVPGEFISTTPSNLDIAGHLRLLRYRVSTLRPIPPSSHGSPMVSRLPGLDVESFVFVRRGGHLSPLQPPYDGPFEVLRAGPKFYRLRVGTREESVSVDRLKVAFFEPGLDPPVAIPPRHGRPPSSPTSTLVPVAPSSRRDRPPSRHPVSPRRRSPPTPHAPEPRFSRAGQPL